MREHFNIGDHKRGIDRMFNIRVQRHEGYYKLSMPKYIDTLIPRREAEGAKGALHVEELSRNSLLLRLHHG